MINIVLRRRLASAIRWALTLGGGWIINQDLVPADEMTTLVAAAVPAIGSLLWSLYEKRWKARG